MISSIYGMVIAMICICVALSLVVVYVMNGLGYMKCMQKAGEAKWKAWIPLYNDFVMYKIVGLNGALITVKIVEVIMSVIYLAMYMSVLGQLSADLDEYAEKTTSSSSYVYESRNVYGTKYLYNSDDLDDEITIDKYVQNSQGLLIMQLVTSALGIGAFVVGIFFAIYISKAYGLGGGYIAGMILVPTIFILIIGFGKSEYKGNYVANNNK